MPINIKKKNTKNRSKNKSQNRSKNRSKNSLPKNKSLKKNNLKIKKGGS